MPFPRQKVIKDTVTPQDAEVGYVEVGVFNGGLLAVDVVIFDHGYGFIRQKSSFPLIFLCKIPQFLQ
jgi:hypothetical protein